MKYFTFALCCLFATLALSSSRAEEKPSSPTTGKSAADVQLQQTGKNVKVMIGGEHFTTYDSENYAKPILYPILGPGQIGMTRNWPMKDNVKGEAHDHPHHKSMWISHQISGEDFWSERDGVVRTTKIETSFEGQPQNVFRTTSDWVKKSDQKTLFTDQTAYRFGSSSDSRWIDCTITYRADHGDIVFEDTKEGLFAIRTHPDLRLTPRPKDGVVEVFGKAVNSEGVGGKAIWGKQAKWLLYQGPIDGKPMSIAMYDHPQNLRHPTTWHARDYGLVTANPFGTHYFLGKDKGEGAFTIKAGDELTLRYRVEFIDGLATAEDIASRHAAFSTPVKQLTSKN